MKHCQSRRPAALAVVCLLTLACAACDPAPYEGDLVPATVVDNPALPAISIMVDGHSRRIHCRSFGDQAAPVLLVMHGSLSDLRAYLPFKAFTDRYRVVLWDMRGNGLSERVPADELDYADMAEELHALKLHFSPGRPVTAVGHSWSAVFVARYLAAYPGELDQAVLLEPAPLSTAIAGHLPAIINLSRIGYLDMFWSAEMLSPLDHARLDFRTQGMLHSAVRNFFLDPDHLPDWPVWRVGGLALLHWEAGVVGDYDFTGGLAGFGGEVLLVGSSASPIGYAFQETWHQGLFSKARSLRIENSGHRMITEQWGALEAGIRAFLKEYRGASS